MDSSDSAVGLRDMADRLQKLRAQRAGQQSYQSRIAVIEMVFTRSRNKSNF